MSKRNKKEEKAQEDKPTEEVVEDKPTEEVVEDKPTEEAVEDKPTEEAVEDKPTEEAVEDKPAKKTQKYIHNCTKCGNCCEKWSEIPFYLEDLQRWIKDGSINYVLPFIQLEETPPLYVRMFLKRVPVEGDDPNPSGCPLYDYENKICNLYSSMPLHCVAYPLAYNGEKFYLVDTESPGLGSGNMSKESLAEARLRAQNHFSALTATNSILPLIYSLILGNMIKRNKEAMDAMSEEDREKLEELMKNSEEDTADEPEQAEPEQAEPEQAEPEQAEPEQAEPEKDVDDFEDLEEIEE
ncbi:MAG: YkgJ family cysteine cluster protein [Candidatus Heimdallarchaeaceae archaeon]